MINEKWLNLQLFAGEGAGDGGGEGAATGATSSNNGDADQALRELGVPAAVLEKRAKRNAAKQPKGAAKTAGNQAPAQVQTPAPAEQQTEEQAAAAENPTEENTDAPTKPTWKEIMDDPDYNKCMQETVQARIGAAKAAVEAMGKMAPAIELLARNHGQDPAKPDYDALAKAICDDDANHEDEALKNGESLEETKRKFQEQFQQRTIDQQRFQQHIANLEQQGEAMKKVFPNFNLRTELQNPAFARMTSPNVGISVEDAYYAVHRKDIQTAAMQVTAQKVAQKISNDIQSGNRRPNENGTSGQAPSVTTFDYSKASPEQRAAFKQYLRSEAAKGRKVYPGR